MNDNPSQTRVDETPLPHRRIDLRATGVAGFAGPAVSGPVERAQALTSFAEFTRVYGDGPPSSPGAGAAPPAFLGHAVRAFFAEGGTRLYIVRTRPSEGAAPDVVYGPALQALAEATDVSIVAAPGSTYVAGSGRADETCAPAIEDLLIRHAEQMGDRIALLDSVNGLDSDGVRAQRNRVDSSYAALYYPWLRASDPTTGAAILLPASGFVAGIIARADARRGPWAAPANETVQLAVGLERPLDVVQSESLNAAGINTFRQLNDRGVVLWGARTASDDPTWQYVNLRRYSMLLERSIDEGLQWTVFEPNGEALWSAVRQTVEAFLLSQWRSGGLAGTKAEQAFFVHCDRTTMTQQDLDDGRLVCDVGLALIRPAEFVIIRIGLWTADHRP